MRFSLRSWVAAAGAVTLALAFSACQTAEPQTTDPPPASHIKTEVKDGPLVPKADSDGYTVHLRCFTAEEADAIELSFKEFDGYQDHELHRITSIPDIYLSNGQILTVREYEYRTLATTSDLNAAFSQDIDDEYASIDFEEGTFTIDRKVTIDQEVLEIGETTKKYIQKISFPCDNLLEGFVETEGL